MHIDRTPDHTSRAMRHMFSAIARGDADAAWRWSLIIERQLNILLKLVDLDAGDHRLRRFSYALSLMKQEIRKLLK